MRNEKKNIRLGALLLAYLAAVCVAFLLSSVIHTQFVLASLTELGVEIGWHDRLLSTGKDILGLLPGYGAVIAIGLALGFSFIGLLRRFMPLPAMAAYPIGGILAYLAFLAAMHPLLDVTLIASTRTLAGILGQCVAGLAAGLVFAICYHRHTATT